MHPRLPQDEKALKFFSSISQEWRLFWAIESVGISFSLALVAIFIVGDSTQLLQADSESLDGYPSWMLWVVNPAVATMVAYHLSASLQTWFAACSESFDGMDPLEFRSVVKRASESLSAAISRGKAFLLEESFFCVSMIMWLVQGAIRWWVYIFSLGPPLAFSCYSDSGESFRTCVTENIWALIFVNVMLIVGVVLKFLGVGVTEQEGIAAVPRPCCSCARGSRFTSLLIGWGLAYWLTSVLQLFCASWYRCGWDDAPTIVRYVGYAVVLCFVLVSIVMMADVSFLGTAVEERINPIIDILVDGQGITYWVMATVFRDAVMLWGLSCLLVAHLF